MIKLKKIKALHIYVFMLNYPLIWAVGSVVWDGTVGIVSVVRKQVPVGVICLCRA